MTYHLELFHTLLNEFLSGDSALLTTDGDVLAVRGSNPINCGTLPAAAMNVIKYLKLQEGDIVLLNDPYSGGSVLSSFTFVTAISEDLLWLKSLPHCTSWSVANSIEQEGLRIPPTPIRQGGKMNEMILQAMQGHPACPSDFSEWIKAQCEIILRSCQKFVRATETIDLELDTELITQYFKLCKQVAQHKISEAASGDARVDIKLDGGDMIRLKLEVNEGRINVDFSGTTVSKTVNLTESATLGTCFHWIARYYGFLDFANSGTFSVLQITKPVGCMLQSKYPAPTVKGMSDGVAALQMGLQTAFSHIHQKRETAPHGTSSLRLQIQKGPQSLVLTLPGGTGANLENDGVPAAGLCEQISIEKAEKNFPVLFEKIAYREETAETHKFKGGPGLTLQFKALEEVQISWMSDLNAHSPKLSKNCFSGEKNRVRLTNAKGEQNLPLQGQQAVQKGERSTFDSANGGSYGKA